jgi:hypothetical protein
MSGIDFGAFAENLAQTGGRVLNQARDYNLQLAQFRQAAQSRKFQQDLETQAAEQDRQKFLLDKQASEFAIKQQLASEKLRNQAMSIISSAKAKGPTGKPTALGGAIAAGQIDKPHVMLAQAYTQAGLPVPEDILNQAHEEAMTPEMRKARDIENKAKEALGTQRTASAERGNQRLIQSIDANGNSVWMMVDVPTAKAGEVTTAGGGTAGVDKTGDVPLHPNSYYANLATTEINNNIDYYGMSDAEKAPLITARAEALKAMDMENPPRPGGKTGGGQEVSTSQFDKFKIKK